MACVRVGAPARIRWQEEAVRHGVPFSPVRMRCQAGTRAATGIPAAFPACVPLFPPPQTILTPLNSRLQQDPHAALPWSGPAPSGLSPAAHPRSGAPAARASSSHTCTHDTCSRFSLAGTPLLQEANPSPPSAAFSQTTFWGGLALPPPSRPCVPSGSFSPGHFSPLNQ